MFAVLQAWVLAMTQWNVMVAQCGQSQLPEAF